MKRLLLLTTLWTCCTASAQGVADVFKSITGARREVIAVLPKVAREELAMALKATAARGTKVFLITEQASVKRGGYLLNVSHGPGSIYTYLYHGILPDAWVMVDGAWYVSGPGLDTSQSRSVQISQDARKRQQLSLWVKNITQRGPIPRVDLVRMRFQK